MEMEIRTKGLVGFENFNLKMDLVKLTKAAKNRSFANLSNCCKVPLKQSKACSACAKPVDEKSELKGFKIGKDTYPIPAATLDQIKESLDSDIITVSEFRDKTEISELYYTDEIYAVEPNKKYAKELAEFTAILKQTNKVAVGMATIRSRPYPVVFSVYTNDTIVMRALHFFEEVGTLPAINPVTYNQAKVSLLIQVMGLTKNEPFDIAKFENLRNTAEEKMMEASLKGEAIIVPEKIVMTTTEDESEMKRLQEMLLAATSAKTA